MRRGRLAKRLKEETKGKRHEPMDTARWLARPKSFVSREEAFALIRQYYYEIERNRWKRNPFLLVPWALILIVTFPFRWAWKGIQHLLEKRGGEDA